MKDTGHPWLPKIPEEWELRRNGRLFRVRRETDFPDLPILEVSIRSGVQVRDMEGGKRKQVIEDRSKYQRAVQGDLAYNMMRMWQGAVGMVPEDGLVSPAYVVVSPHSDVSGAYYAYLFRTAAYKAEIDSFSRGIVPDRNRLYPDAFKQMPSAFPPFAEQQSIVRFLDWHGAMTFRLIRAKKRLIAVLTEQKQSIIHHAVTRGVDTTAKLKPSGIDCLGDVPEKWEVKRLRNVVEMRVSNVDKKEHEGEEPVRLCNYVDVYKNETIHPAIPFMVATASRAEIERFKLKLGDVIITKDSEDWQDIGVPALVVTAGEDLVCAYHLALLRPKPSAIEGSFLYWQLLGSAARLHFARHANGVTRYGLSQGAIKALPIILPPIKEQQKIVAALDLATADIRLAVADAEREVGFLQEFRTRLIADVVTGQLDIREFAATLPDTSIDQIEDETGETDLTETEGDLVDQEVAAT